MKDNSGLSKQCAKMIVSILVMTRLKDKQQLIETTRLMCDVADNSSEYSPVARQIYKMVYSFFKVVWREDLEQIIKIVFDGKQV